MIQLKYVKTKLASISALTIVGFSILIMLILYFSNTQNEFLEVRKYSKELQVSIIDLHHISKLKANDDRFFQKFKTVENNLSLLEESMTNTSQNIDSLELLKKELKKVKISYKTVFDTQKQINKYLEEMNSSKEMIQKIFEKVYDYKLIQFMMKLELSELSFINTGKVDLKEFGRTHFKMRRSVRGSENFTTDKAMQKKINDALILYKNMFESVVEEQKKINELKTKLNKDFNLTLESLDSTNKIIVQNISSSSDRLLYIIILISIFIVVLQFIIATLISRGIIQSLHIVHQGLNSFFDVINYKSSSAEDIIVPTKDEFFNIANDINNNIHSSVELINHNKEVLEEANDVLQKVSNGFYGYKIPHHNNVSPDVKDLIININKMLDETKNKFEILNRALAAYGSYNFEHEIPKKDETGLYGDFGSLVARTKLIGNNVSEFLAMIVNSGEKLNKDTSTLNKSANELSNASNMQAASLEETSASLEEVTKNILENTNHTKQMASYAHDLTESSENGKKLANETASAMDLITTKVNAISEAISVIDQIAFQTNILSLNAAVEAATAGEAGKGFAVVAGEVRNLASRSAEAANEIKALVEDATTKALNGKTIATKMSKDYEELNKKVENTTKIIQSVSEASQRQHENIKQINDTMAVLDKNTQINAKNAQYISELSQSISYLSEDLIGAASRATFNPRIKQQVCNIELVYETSKLKNDHLVLKTESFEHIGDFSPYQITSPSACKMAQWIKDQESENRAFTNSTTWQELKSEHENVHKAIQKYVDENAKQVSNDILRELASNIETHTLALFDLLNEIKIVECDSLK